MTPVERWMLPDGIEEILPPEAREMDQLRRHLLDLFSRWGYELVIPPMMEFTDSLLVGLGKDVDLLTFKVTDQISGRSMGIRADMTPQIARIDAHSLGRRGVNRLCYSGHVLKSVMANALGTRSPMQVGVELFGEPGLDADAEVVSLLLDALHQAQLPQICLDLGHVGIFRALSEAAGLSEEKELAFFDLLQAKALTEIGQWVKTHIQDERLASWFLALPRLSGATQILDDAREVLAGAPEEVHKALDELQAMATLVNERFPQIQLYFDLSELTGYHYLTGLVFAAFVPGQGSAIARGGRYNHIGKVFGRARSATGFTADLVAISRLGVRESRPHAAIFAPASENPEQWREIQRLRAGGEAVVCAMGQQAQPDQHQICDRKLIEENGRFKVVALD